MSNPGNNHKPKIILPSGMAEGDTPLQNLAGHAAAVARQRLENQARIEVLFRRAFEDVVFKYYEQLKAAGWQAPEEGDVSHEALFWREPSGKYGVASVQAAWVGFRMGIGFAVSNNATLPDVLAGSGFTPEMLLGGLQ